MSDCQRCGVCCHHVGETFWRHSDEPEIARLAARVQSRDDGVRCAEQENKE